MHASTLLAVLMMLSSAFALYGLGYDTRQIEDRVRKTEAAAEQLRSEISVLRADRAHLGRPERIEPHARALGLAPVQRGQIEADPMRVAERKP